MARQLVPVRVRAGEETEVEVRVLAGLRQRFRFAAPAPLDELRVRVLRGGEAVFQTAFHEDFSHPIPGQWEYWLAPGAYPVTARGNGLSGQAAFTVREGTNEVVRVVMQ